jgi:hypothetical protein
MIGAVLSLFGYAKVPRETVLLCTAIRRLWKRDQNDPRIDKGLETLEKLLRSTQFKEKQ